MAIQKEIITGRLHEPDGDPITSGKVRFTLSRYDATDNGVIAASRKIEAELQADGSIALELWPNTAGLRGTTYLVELISERGYPVETYGRIQVGEDGPYSLADLLRVDSPPAGNTFWSSISEADYNAKIAEMDAKAKAASDSAELSQAWAEGTEPGGTGTKSAEEWAGVAQGIKDSIDLGALDDAVAATEADAAATAADRVQTGLDREYVTERAAALEGISASGVVRKEAASCATTANITLSGEQTIDGVSTSASRVLVKNQSTAAQNGIYVSAAGAWARATDMDAADEVQGAAVYVTGGTVGAGKTYYTGSAVATLGTDAIAWVVSEDQGALQAEVATKASASDVSSIQSLTITNNQRRYGNRADLSGVSGGSGPGNVDIVFNEVITGKNVTVTAVNVAASGTGTGYVRSWVKSGNTFTMHDEAALSLVAGYQSVAMSLEVPESGYLGFASGGVIVATTVGADPNGFQSSTGGGATFTSASAGNTGTFAVQFIVEQGAATPTPGAAAKSTTRGVASVEWATGGAVTQYRVDGNALSAGGTFDSIDLRMDDTGTPVAYVYVREGNVMVPYSSVSLGSLSAGIHKGLSVGLDVPAGGYVGIYCQNVANSSEIDQWPQFYYGTTATFTDADDTPVGSPALVRFSCTENSLDTAQKVYDDLLPASGLKTSGAVFAGNTVMVCNNGQSLAIGSGNTPQTVDLRTSVVYEDTSGDESTLPGTLAGLWELLESDDGLSAGSISYVQVGTTRGQGGQPIANLVKGGSTGKYEDTIADITDVAPDAVTCVTWSQGENDVTIDTSYSAYYSALVGLADDYNADVPALTRQTRPVYLITYQTVSTRSDDMDVPRAQLRAAQDHPHIIMAGPMYHLNFHDGLHYDGESAVIAGAYFALAQKRTIIDGVPWEPLMPVRSEIVGNCIDLYFNKRGLNFDTTNFPAQTNYGFTVQNDVGTDQTISSVEVLGSDRVRVRCASAPSADWTVNYGRDAVTGKTHPTTTTAYTAHGGNLRDNQGDYLTMAGHPMHNWSVLFAWVV